MKKTYIAPEAELLKLNVEMPLAASAVSGNGGGVDAGWGGYGGGEGDAKEDDVQWDW